MTDSPDQELTLPIPPGQQIPGVEEMGGGFYIDPNFNQWLIDHGRDPQLDLYPQSARLLLEHTIETQKRND